MASVVISRIGEPISWVLAGPPRDEERRRSVGRWASSVENTAGPGSPHSGRFQVRHRRERGTPLAEQRPANIAKKGSIGCGLWLRGWRGADARDEGIFNWAMKTDAERRFASAGIQLLRLPRYYLRAVRCCLSRVALMACLGFVERAQLGIIAVAGHRRRDGFRAS
jgi:hypothetical protein